MTEKKSKTTKKKASFEESLDELDMIIHKMESRDLGLSEALAAYEQGVTLLRHLHEELSDIEQRVVTLVRIDEDGNPVFESAHTAPENGHNTSKAGRRKKTKVQGEKAEDQPKKQRISTSHHETRHQLPGMDEATPGA